MTFLLAPEVTLVDYLGDDLTVVNLSLIHI